jgi:hypothetical protein
VIVGLNFLLQRWKKIERILSVLQVKEFDKFLICKGKINSEKKAKLINFSFASN